MTPAETIVAEAGGFLFLGAVLAVTRECIRKNWIKVSFSFGITTPEARFLKPPRETQAPPKVPEPATGPVPISEKRGAA